MCAESTRRVIRSYDDLDVYQRAMAVLKPIHDAVKSFPDYEKFDLANQIRRASKSVPANIAEGYGRRRSAKEFRLFLTNALGSSTEMQSHMKIAQVLEYLPPEEVATFIEEYKIIARQLYRLIEHWQTFERTPPSDQENGV